MCAPPPDEFAHWRAARLSTLRRGSTPRPARACSSSARISSAGAPSKSGGPPTSFCRCPNALARGVVAYSSGNHAQATAIAARHVGAQATIVMPEDAPRSKMEATRGYGARIVTYNRFTDSREQIAGGMLEESGATLVPPFDHPMIMAGQGTAALELLEETGPLDALIAPIGGGGLLSGCATIAARSSARHPHLRRRTGGRQRHVPLATGREARGGAGGQYHRRRAAVSPAGRADVPHSATPGGARGAGER